MGWLHTSGQTRRELIENRIRREETDKAIWETIAYCTRGNVLWKVVKITYKSTGKSETFIGCDLLFSQKGYGWGYRDMDESAHPYYYSCPLKYLDMAPVANAEWRAEVMKYWAKKKEQSERYKAIKPGNWYTLQGCVLPKIYITSKVKRHWIGIYNGTRYRVKKRHIKDIITA